jgi:hypothetical protein
VTGDANATVPAIRANAAARSSPNVKGYEVMTTAAGGIAGM